MVDSQFWFANVGDDRIIKLYIEKVRAEWKMVETKMNSLGGVESLLLP